MENHKFTNIWKINRTEKCLARLIKKTREDSNKIRNERDGIINTTQKISTIKDY